MFIIGDASTKHTGNYTCHASNPAATVTYTSQLHVDGMYIDIFLSSLF
jgi:hypothetical protein